MFSLQSNTLDKPFFCPLSKAEGPIDLPKKVSSEILENSPAENDIKSESNDFSNQEVQTYGSVPLISEESIAKIADIFQQTLQSKFLGAIFGAAIGDAMGKPTEFIPSLDKLYAKYPHGVRGFDDFQDKWKIGSDGQPYVPYTDDTQLSMIVLEIFTQARENQWNIEKTMSTLAQRFVNWRHDPTTMQRAPGGTCTSACDTLEKKILQKQTDQPRWWSVGNLHSQGSGSVMRSYPLGLIFADNLKKAEKYAVLQSKLTHKHPAALAACAAMAVGIGMALKKDNPKVIVKEMISVAKKYDLKTAKMMIKAMEEAKNGSSPKKVLGEVDRKKYGPFYGWRADEAIAGCVYLFMRNPKNPNNAILEGINTPGDSDTLGTLAGALTGTFNGINAIKADWISLIEDSILLSNLAKNIPIEIANALAASEISQK
jgi:ADP-ribosylglycohydrolase